MSKKLIIILGFCLAPTILTAPTLAQTIALSFPLEGRTPYTAAITSVLDHSSLPDGKFYCNYQTTTNGTVEAHPNERL